MADVDIVITWVDGSDPNHAEKRAKHIGGINSDFKLEATGQIRWQDSNEISNCLRSIELFAPWVRKIWIVTDEQTPLISVSKATRDKISIVDHSEIFRDNLNVLPSFNSISISSVLWKIKGLSENFIYFNDDCFLTNPVSKSDFFYKEGIIFRGRMKKFDDLSLLYNMHKYNALKLFDGGRTAGYSYDHIAIPTKKSWFEGVSKKFQKQIEENIAHRFRHETQFSMFALVTIGAAARGLAYKRLYKDWEHFPAKIAQEGTESEVKLKLAKLNRKHILLGCMNDVHTLQERSVDTNSFFNDTILNPNKPGNRLRTTLRRLPVMRLSDRRH